LYAKSGAQTGIMNEAGGKMHANRRFGRIRLFENCRSINKNPSVLESYSSKM